MRSRAASTLGMPSSRLMVLMAAGLRDMADKYNGESDVPEMLLLFRALLFRPGPAGFNGGANAATRTKYTFHHDPFWFRRSRYIFQNLVDNVLLKNPKVAVVQQILFERLQFQAELGRHIANFQRAKIGQPGFRTNRSKLRNINQDLVGGKLVGPGINFREAVVQPGFCMIFGVTCTM